MMSISAVVENQQISHIAMVRIKNRCRVPGARCRVIEVLNLIFKVTSDIRYQISDIKYQISDIPRASALQALPLNLHP
jgi:hypothetical protein